MLKILQAKLKQSVNWELPDVQAELQRGQGTKGQIVNIHWIIEKAKKFQKNNYFCFIDYAKTFDCVGHNKLGILKFLEMGIPAPLPVSWEICMQVKKQQLEPDMEQMTGSKLEISTVRLYIVTLLFLTYMQSTSWEIPGWMNHNLESRLMGEISTTSDMQMIPL